jgi:hypothetical protein
MQGFSTNWWDAPVSCSCPPDQAARQSERGSPFIFGSRHPAAVFFVIHAQQVKYAVEHQNLDLCADWVAVLRGLALGVLKRDRNVANEPQSSPRWKRQHVCGVIVLEKIPVQPAQLGIARYQAGKRPSAGHLRFQLLGECARRSSRKAWRGRME